MTNFCLTLAALSVAVLIWAAVYAAIAWLGLRASRFVPTHWYQVARPEHPRKGEPR